MISIGEKWWHYLAVKKLSALLRRIATKNKSDFYCLNFLYSFRTKTKLESHKEVCDDKDFCNVIMPFEDTTILVFNRYQKSDKAPFIICADLKYIIEKIDVCKNDHERLCTTKVNKNIPSSSWMYIISSFRSMENKHGVYRGKDCIKDFCEFLREHAMKIINFKVKEMMLLTKEQQESYENAQVCYICKRKFENKYLKDKKYCKVRNHCHYTGECAAHSICKFKHKVSKDIRIDFHNGSNYDYYFIKRVSKKKLKSFLV